MASKNLHGSDEISHDSNPDAITGAPGSHPVGTGVGAAAAGAAGAAIGSAAGPIGTAVGAVIGAVAGGLAGKGVAEGINPTEEDAYWRENYSKRPYVQSGADFNEYQPAYRYGYSAYSKYPGKSFEDVENDLSSEWDQTRGQSKLSWEHAKQASRDAWQRVSEREARERNLD